MIHIKDAVIAKKNIKVIGIPDDWTPYDLSRHYIELYNILDSTKGQSTDCLKSWLTSAMQRDNDFTTLKEIEILKDLTHD